MREEEEEEEVAKTHFHFKFLFCSFDLLDNVGQSSRLKKSIGVKYFLACDMSREGTIDPRL